MQDASCQIGAPDNKNSPLIVSAALEIQKNAGSSDAEWRIPRIVAQGGEVIRAESGGRRSDAAAMTNENGNIGLKNSICRYFARGFCERGDKCTFRHDLVSQETGARGYIPRDIREDISTRQVQGSVNGSGSNTLEKERSNPLDPDHRKHEFIARDHISCTISRNDKWPRDSETTKVHEPSRETARLKPSWGPPSNALFLKNLPTHCSAKDIHIAFNKLKGFEVARDAVIYGRPAVFAQFNNADSSTEAIIEMQGKRVLPKSDQGLDIEFAKSGSKFQVEGKDNSKMDVRDGIAELEKEQFRRQAAEEYAGNDRDRNRQNGSHVEDPGSKRERNDDSDKSHQALSGDDRGTREVITQRYVHIQREDSASASQNANARGGGAEATAKKRSPSGHPTTTWCKWGRNCPKLMSKSCRFLHEDSEEDAGSKRQRNAVEEPSASSCGEVPGASRRIKTSEGVAMSVNVGGGTRIASHPYISSSGLGTSVWCRFGTRCNIGSRCNFGHVVVGQSPHAQKSISTSTLDLRQTINSPPPAPSAALDLIKRAECHLSKCEHAEAQQVYVSVKSSDRNAPELSAVAQLQSDIENKKQAAKEKLALALSAAQRPKAADIRLELEAMSSCCTVPMS
jgi:hypothetical protein